MTTIRRLLFSLVIVLGMLLSAQAGPDWVMSEEDQDPVPVVPKATFNANEAKQLLGAGTCRIQGVASFRFKNKLFGKKTPQQHPPLGSKVYLFPYTPYCQEVVKLYKQHTPKQMENSIEALMMEAQLKALTGDGLPLVLPKKKIEIDPGFSKIWLSAYTDKEGKFSFENLKPGRYYLQSMPFHVMRGVSYDVQVGEQVEEVYWSNGEVEVNRYPQWAQESTTMVRQVELVGIVDLGQDGQLVEVELNRDWDDFKP